MSAKNDSGQQATSIKNRISFPLQRLVSCPGCGANPRPYRHYADGVNDEYVIDHKKGCVRGSKFDPIRMWIKGKENHNKWNRVGS